MNKHINILIIDDNQTNVLLIQRILEGYNYNVSAILDSSEVVDVLANNHYDLILLDIMMPGIDGFEILEMINEKNIKTPVIMVSACHEKRYVTKAFENGAYDYLKKPVRKRELIESVEKALVSEQIDFEKREEKVMEKTESKAAGGWFEKYFSSAIRNLSKKKRILVVDDNVSDVILLEHALEEKEYKIISAFDGNSAVEMAVNEKPDLIMLDILLPGIDGMEVLRRIREDAVTADIPVVMVSCIHEHQYIQKAMDLGIESYITKPYKLNKLIDLVDEVFEEQVSTRGARSMKFF